MVQVCSNLLGGGIRWFDTVHVTFNMHMICRRCTRSHCAEGTTAAYGRPLPCSELCPLS